MSTTPVAGARTAAPGTFSAPILSIDASTAYGLCAYVDGAVPAPPPDWEPVWVPDGDSGGNYAVVLMKYIWSVITPLGPPYKLPLPFFALAIQGTKDGKDVLYDFQIVPQQDFSPVAGARIAPGSQTGLDNVLALQRGGQTLREFLTSLGGGELLLVTGHSLGGNVASVMLPWMAANLPAFGGNGGPLSGLPANLNAITFAAPTAGNEAFAAFLDGNPHNYQAYFNQNDVVSNVWATSGPLNLDNIYTLFPSPGPHPAPEDVKLLLDDMKARMAEHRASYTQTSGTIFTYEPETLPPDARDPWMQELNYEHNHAYSAHFLGTGGTGG